METIPPSEKKRRRRRKKVVKVHCEDEYDPYAVELDPAELDL